MIREDRVALNKRFVMVFEELERRGVIRKNDRNGRGMGDVAELMLGNRGYGHIVRAFLDEDNKRVIDYHQARTFSKHYAPYGLNESFLVDGLGISFGEEKALPKLSVPSADDMKRSNAGNIIFTSVEAFAGSSVDMGSFAREQTATFSLPGLSGSGLVAFPVKGNSMEPVIQNGDIVICRQIMSLDEIKENQIYAVRNLGQVWVKYVQPVPSRVSKVAKLKLLSANYIEFDPFVEEVNETTQLFKVVRRITEM